MFSPFDIQREFPRVSAGKPLVKRHVELIRTQAPIYQEKLRSIRAKAQVQDLRNLATLWDEYFSDSINRALSAGERCLLALSLFDKVITADGYHMTDEKAQILIAIQGNCDLLASITSTMYDNCMELSDDVIPSLRDCEQFEEFELFLSDSISELSSTLCFTQKALSNISTSIGTYYRYPQDQNSKKPMFQAEFILGLVCITIWLMMILAKFK